MDLKLFEMYEGDTQELVITVTTIDNSPVELNTASSISFSIVNDSGTNMLTKTLDDGIEVLNNVFTVKIQPEDTEGYSGAFNCEAEVIDGLGNVSTVLQGQIEIKKTYI